MVEAESVCVVHECFEPDDRESSCDGHSWKSEKNDLNDWSGVNNDVTPDTHAWLPTLPSESGHTPSLRHNYFPVRIPLGQSMPADASGTVPSCASCPAFPAVGADHQVLYGIWRARPAPSNQCDFYASRVRTEADGGVPCYFISRCDKSIVRHRVRP